MIYVYSFYILGSTVPIFPWYDSAITIAMFALVYLVPIQIITLIVGALIKKNNWVPSFINLFLISSILLAAMKDMAFFHELALPYAVIELLIILFWIYSAIKQLSNKNNFTN